VSTKVEEGGGWRFGGKRRRKWVVMLMSACTMYQDCGYLGPGTHAIPNEAVPCLSAMPSRRSPRNYGLMAFGIVVSCLT
jgi:hypothetical protein